jgi:ribonuclease Z
MRRYLWLLAAGVIVLTLTMAALLFSERLQGALADRMIKKNLGQVNSALLGGDALRVILIGSGGPIANETRSAPCLAVLAGSTALLVDVGPGAWKNISRFQLPAARLDLILLTHFHSDHIGDLGEVNMQTWLAGRPRPLSVYGPPGVETVTAGFQAAYELDIGYRVMHHGQATMPEAGGQIKSITVDAPPAGSNTFYDRDGLKLAAFTVDHYPAKPAYGYRIEYKGRVLVVSGDTSKCQNVAVNARGADLLVHCALSDTMMSRISRHAAETGLPRVAQMADDVLTYQATPIQAAETAREAGVKMLVLSHVTPPLPNWLAQGMFMKGVNNTWSGEVVLGEDGLLFNLPVGSDLMEIKKLR